MNKKKFKIHERLYSFKYAFNGIKELIDNEHNFWIHLCATFLVIVAGFLFKVSTLEWLAIVFGIGFVITLEAINSSIEKLSDFVSPDKNDHIKKVKDLAAAGVLISSATALIIGLIIFLPKIFTLLMKI